MNCNETLVFLEEMSRMCDSNLRSCRDCVIYDLRKHEEVGCFHYVRKHPAEVVKIIQEWSDKHPKRTRYSVALERNPNMRMQILVDIPIICCGELFGFTCPYGMKNSNSDCYKCWHTEMED